MCITKRYIEEALLFNKAGLLRPGHTRISIPYKTTVGSNEDYINFVCSAIEWICKYGWSMIMEAYQVNSYLITHHLHLMMKMIIFPKTM